jgi:hypothetical protein
MANLQFVAAADNLHVWRAAANITWDAQSRTAEKE